MRATEPAASLPEKAVRANYWAFLFEGGFFVFAMGFVNGQTLLPALILEEGGPSWVAAFMPSVMVIGMFSVPMLLAGWIDGLPRLRPYVVLTGFVQRLVYLPVGLLLLYGGLADPAVVLLLALTPLLSGLLGGLGFSAWQRLYMNAVPPGRRASNLAYRLLIGGISGIVAGALIERILNRHPGPAGYGILHLSAFVLFLASWAMLFLVREPPRRPPAERAMATGRGVFRVLRSYYEAGPQRRSRLCFVGALFCMHGFMLMTPFYAVTLLESLAMPKGFLGVLAMWQMGGQAIGNLLAAAIGDRWGGRVIFGIGLVAVVSTAVVAPFVTTPLAAQFAYAGFGLSMMLLIVGKDTLLMELSPEEGQSSYLAGMALLTMTALLLYGGLAQTLWSFLGGFSSLVAGTVLLSFGALGFLAFVHDPRARHVSPLRAVRRGFLRAFR